MTLSAAYGGEKWSQRLTSMREDMAETWGDWGASSECGKLRAVLLHRPGPELDAIQDVDAAHMRSRLDPELARSQHDSLADIYRSTGVDVHYVGETRSDKPNQMFIRDLMLMTPEGAIVGRPASTVRAGEERFVSEALGRIGVPVLMSVHGNGTFEGADVSWVDRDLCFLAEGLRTNEEGANQVERMLHEIGVKDIVRIGLPYGAMHLDSLINFPDRDLAVVWPRRTPLKIVQTLRKRGFRILDVPDEPETYNTYPLNFVTVEPGKIVMPAGNERMIAAYEAAGVEVIPVNVSELMKAGGAMHCLTGFLKRDEL